MNTNTNKIVRDTFGVIEQSTKELYPDIISCSISVEYFSSYHLKVDFFIKEGVIYKLHKDTRLLKALKALKELKELKEPNKDTEDKLRVIISFQRRIDIDIAMARLYTEDRAMAKEKINKTNKTNKTEEAT